MSKYDEDINCGSFTIKRKGGITNLKPNISADETKQIMKTQLPTVKNKMNDLLSEIEILILDDLNPLDALGYITTKNLVGNAERIEEYYASSQLEVEIVQNIILKHELENYRKLSVYESIGKLDNLLSDYRNSLQYYLMCENRLDETLNLIEQEIRFKTITDFLILRGDAFPLHYKKVALGLFSDSRIKEMLLKLGFTIEEYFETIEEIERQCIASVTDKTTKTNEIHKDFLEFIDENFKESDDPTNIIDKYERQVGEESLEQYRRYFMGVDFKKYYKITLNEKVNEKILDLLSLTFGCNEQWKYPLDKSDIETKPIISIDKKYYCFLIPHLIRNIVPIIESLFSEKLSEREFNKYLKIKSDFFETKSFELFRNILPNGTIHEKLYYPINEDGKCKYPEIDGIVSYNDNLLLVEVKAKKRRSIAGRKDILTISKSDFKKNISEAFEQSKRAYDYISTSEEVGFYNNNHKQVMRIKKADYNNIFLVNISLESFQEYSTALNRVKLWDSELLYGAHYPFAVSIYDLMVITEILENSDDFVKYLMERINLNKKQGINSVDEIELLGYFLKHGTLSIGMDLPKSTQAIIRGYSYDIVKYYFYLQGTIKYAEKPVRNKTQSEITREKLEKGSLSKNNLCWCGSLKKYKHCCGK